MSFNSVLLLLLLLEAESILSPAHSCSSWRYRNCSKQSLSNLAYRCYYSDFLLKVFMVYFGILVNSWAFPWEWRSTCTWANKLECCSRDPSIRQERRSFRERWRSSRGSPNAPPCSHRKAIYPTGSNRIYQTGWTLMMIRLRYQIYFHHPNDSSN
jgi:hypothetical protein